ncbi:MAG: LuxR family transcriptional regulator, partial [Anaerolineae bacterium]|nr:LuxR family transcriptional regulator [Anaerolineae bacterium]NIN99040.1 LuxR family transcriptional regulator [Anaerolineae bacterium]
MVEGIADFIAPVLRAKLERVSEERQRKRAEEELEAYAYALNERVKELNCLFEISRLVERPGISLEEILQGVVDLIPAAWQYPEITCARLTLKDQEFQTENFEESTWQQLADIAVQAERVGTLQVYYL